jgi:hypothetical protein
VGVVLVMQLLERRLLPLFLLAKYLNGVLKLHESCSFSIDVLPSGFGALSCCLSYCGGFLLFMEPLDLRRPGPPNLQLEAAQAPHSFGWLGLATASAGAIDAGHFRWFELSWSL